MIINTNGGKVDIETSPDCFKKALGVRGIDLMPGEILHVNDAESDFVIIGIQYLNSMTHPIAPFRVWGKIDEDFKYINASEFKCGLCYKKIEYDQPQPNRRNCP